MNPQPRKIKIVLFSEHPVIDFSQSEPCLFDITAKDLNCPPSFIVQNSFSLEAYCEALLQKVNEIGKTDITECLDYHCSRLNKPIEWLDSFESLIESNYDYFSEECVKTKVQKLYMNIQVCRDNIKHKKKPIKSQLVNWDSILSENDTVKFDFNMVKYDLQKLQTYNEKKVYLIELRADYLQSENMMNIVSNKSFVMLIDIELDKLEKLNQIPTETKMDKFVRPQNRSKVRINGNTNILTDIFYRLLYEFKPEGKPFIDASPTDIANLIVENFKNRDGKNLTASTIQSTLSPGKADKRPSCDKRFCLQHLTSTSLLVYCLYIPEIIHCIVDLDILF